MSEEFERELSYWLVEKLKGHTVGVIRNLDGHCMAFQGVSVGKGRTIVIKDLLQFIEENRK